MKNSTGKSSTHNISSVRHRPGRNTLHTLELQEHLSPLGELTVSGRRGGTIQQSVGLGLRLKTLNRRGTDKSDDCLDMANSGRR